MSPNSPVEYEGNRKYGSFVWLFVFNGMANTTVYFR